MNELQKPMLVSVASSIRFVKLEDIGCIFLDFFKRKVLTSSSISVVGSAHFPLFAASVVLTSLGIMIAP